MDDIDIDLGQIIAPENQIRAAVDAAVDKANDHPWTAAASSGRWSDVSVMRRSHVVMLRISWPVNDSGTRFDCANGTVQFAAVAQWARPGQSIYFPVRLRRAGGTVWIPGIARVTPNGDVNIYNALFPSEGDTAPVVYSGIFNSIYGTAIYIAGEQSNDQA